MIKAVIVDDEKPAREELKFLLESMVPVEVVGEAGSADEALRLIAETRPDVVFLDIEMPGKSGLEIAADLSRQPGQPRVVFATAYDEYAVRAFEVSAVDYILKPFDPRRVREAVDKLARTVDRDGLNHLTEKLISEISQRMQTSKLPAEKNGSTILIDSSELMYAYSHDSKVLLKTFDREYVTKLTLSGVEHRLGPRFLRIHRRFIVNLDRIAEIIPWFSGTYVVTMKDKQGSKIPVSRSQVKKLKNALGI
jgi:DNA-binding LytR/AlgR family response regulator